MKPGASRSYREPPGHTGRVGKYVSVSYVLCLVSHFEYHRNTHDIHNGGHDTANASPNPSLTSNGNPTLWG